MSTDTTITKPLTTEDKVIESPCPGCGVAVPRTIPAGTLTSVARMLAGIGVMCNACGDADDEAQAAEERNRIRAARVERSQMPVMLRNLTWESYLTETPGAAEAKAAAQAWAAQDRKREDGEGVKRGLMLTGPVGVGKTRLAATATWAAFDNWSVRYINVAELIVKLSASFGDSERAAALRVLTGASPLVLDDLDKVNPTMQVLASLYTAIDGRVQAGAPLIVTTNLTPRQLVEKFSKPGRNDDEDERRVAAEAIVSRLVGYCRVMSIQGADRRRG